MTTLETIKFELDNYLEFDSSELFNKEHIDLVSIFGGAIRDIVAGQPEKIKDIDIIGLPISLSHITDVLLKNGYTKMNLVKPELHLIYKEIKFIFEPLTYMNNNLKIVQLIRPHTVNVRNSPPNEYHLVRQNYYSLLSNVDLTSSGLFYDGEELFESVNYAYIHCKLKIFEKLPHAVMYNNQRTYLRAEMLMYKGWEELDDTTLVKRAMKIHRIKNQTLRNLDNYIIKTISIPAKDRYDLNPLKNDRWL